MAKKHSRLTLTDRRNIEDGLNLKPSIIDIERSRRGERSLQRAK